MNSKHYAIIGRPEPLNEPEAFWVDPAVQTDRAAFYAKVRERADMLARKYGSAPIAIHGKIEPDFGERARRIKSNERERIERLSA